MIEQEFEKKLWAAADALRGNISSENYMHIIIGILFIKNMSDKYDDSIEKIKKEFPNNWEDLSKDKSILENFGTSFIIPKVANWGYLEKFATQEVIGEKIDSAFFEIEKSNPELKGLFNKNYNREELDQGRLGQVVSEFSNIRIDESKDIVGRVYEYFLGQFFLKQGQKGGEFYTPKSIVELLSKIVDPDGKKPRSIYDPTAGTGGMLVQARKSIIENKGNPDNLNAYGQELMNETWKLSRVNLLLHGFSNDAIHLGDKSADTLLNDLHENKKFDYVMANPPFNIKKWGHDKLEGDERWMWGEPPKGNANYAFISHMISKLKNDGRGATVLANGSLSGSGKEEVTIRKNLVKDNLIDAIISLPDKLFFTTGIPVCIWVFNKKKKNERILMVEAKNLPGNMLSKKNRELTKDDIIKIIGNYKEHSKGNNIEEIGFSKTITKDELENNDWSFVPGRYVGILKEEIDIDATKKEIEELGNELNDLFDQFQKLLPKVKDSIKELIK